MIPRGRNFKSKPLDKRAACRASLCAMAALQRLAPQKKVVVKQAHVMYPPVIKPGNGKSPMNVCFNWKITNTILVHLYPHRWWVFLHYFEAIPRINRSTHSCTHTSLHGYILHSMMYSGWFWWLGNLRSESWDQQRQHICDHCRKDNACRGSVCPCFYQAAKIVSKHEQDKDGFFLVSLFYVGHAF